MIEAKDLRIGNLFVEENTKQIIEVIGLEKNRVVFSGMFLDKWQAQPIPLTDEWLLNFGFTRGIDGYYVDLPFDDNINWNKSQLMIRYYSFGVFTYSEGGGGHGDFDVKYIHELQNLFHCLTKTELQLK